jgi:hypothetical protein
VLHQQGTGNIEPKGDERERQAVAAAVHVCGDAVECLNFEADAQPFEVDPENETVG